MSDQYLSESGVLTGLSPYILPESSLTAFDGSGPSVIRRISSPKGDGTDFDNTVFAGKFKTNDLRNDPTNLFITAYREGPEDTSVNAIEHFYNGYGIAVMPLNAKSASDGRYNIFIVDNALAVPRVVLENVIHTGWGDMPYLSAVSVALNPDTWYDFELHFGTSGTMEFYMAESGSLFGPAVISYGSYQRQAQGTYYGVAISYNEGMKWSIDNLSLTYKNAQHAVNDFLLDSSIFADSFVVKAYAYALGFNGGATPEYGVEMLLYNYTTEAWVSMDSHNNGPGDGSFLLTSGTQIKADYSSPSDGYIRVLIVSEYPSDFVSGIESYLNIDEVFAENWDTAEANVGGMGDVYVRESSTPVEFSFDMYGVNDFEWLRKSNTKIVGDCVLPILLMVKVESIDAMGAVIGLLTEGVGYSISIDDEYRTFSADEQKMMIFAAPIIGSNVRVTYLSYASIEAIQSYLMESRRANFADDLLVFACDPWELRDVVLDYRGSEARAAVRTELVEWIMGTVEDELEDHDIETHLQAMENVSNIQVESMTVRIHRKDGGYTDVTATSFTLSKPDFQQFMILDDATHVSFTPESD